MAKVFVSYSRKDIEFAKRLTAELPKSDLDFWIDWEGIPPTVDWWREIEKGIEEADVFIFLISPDSAKSKICGKEIDTAVKNGKRIIPIVVREIQWEETPPQLGHLNYIFFSRDDDFDTAVKKLMTAIQTDYEWAAAHRRLQVKALDWERNNKDNGFLLRGMDLLDAEQDLAANTSKDPHPTDLQREYVFESRKATDRQRRITTSIAIGGVVVLTVLAVVAVVMAVRATRQAKISRAGELASIAILEKDKHFDLSLLLGVEGFNTFDNTRTRGTLLTLTDSHPRLKNLLFGHTGPVSSIALSPNSQYLASGSFDHSIILWDISSPEMPVRLSTLKSHSDSVTSVAFSPNGKQLSSASTDRSIILWDISNPAAPSRLAVFSDIGGRVSELIYSQDGNHLVSIDSRDSYTENSVTLWDISKPATPSQISIIPDEGTEFSVVGLSSDAKQLALLTDSIILWDISNPSAPSKLATIPPETSFPNVAFSPDGKQLAVGGIKGVPLSLWDISNSGSPSKLATFPEDGSNETWAVFSPDGKRLAAIGTNSTILLWDISYPAYPWKLASLTGHTDYIGTLAFSPDGKKLVSGSFDASIILWDVESAPLSHLATFSADDAPVMSLAFSPEGKQLASGTGIASIVLWDIQNPLVPAKVGQLPVQSDMVHSLAFSPDNKRLASVDDNNFILWDFSNPLAPSRIITLPFARKDFLPAALSINGNRLTLRSNDVPAVLWDITDPAAPIQLGPLPAAGGTFSPDGKWLASVKGDDYYSVVLWEISNLSTPVQLATLAGHTSDVLSLAFSHDGHLLASASMDNSIILWDLSNPTAPVQLATLSGPTDMPLQFPEFTSLAFSPDDTQLASGGFDGITLWDLNAASWVRHACQRVGRNFTRAEWAQYFPGEDYSTDQKDATCPQWPFEPLEPEVTSTPTP